MRETAEKTLKNSKGITLIALIVTIIVLIIIAGISVNLLLGDNGMFVKAQASQMLQEKAEIIEGARLSISSKQIDNEGTITEPEVEVILSDYGTVVKNEDLTLKGLIPTNKDYEISISEIYPAGFSNKNNDDTGKKGGDPKGKSEEIKEQWIIEEDRNNDGFGLGDLIKPNVSSDSVLKDEMFYVIKIEDATDPVITLLARYCVNPETNLQNSQTYAVKFDDAATNYTNVYANASIKGYVDAYGTKLTDVKLPERLTLENVEIAEGGNPVVGTKARLMWGKRGNGTSILGEANLAKNISTDILYGPENGKMNYWLGNADTDTKDYVYSWYVRGTGSNQGVKNKNVEYDPGYGIRPVIKVLQSNIHTSK